MCVHRQYAEDYNKLIGNSHLFWCWCSCCHWAENWTLLGHRNMTWCSNSCQHSMTWADHSLHLINLSSVLIKLPISEVKSSSNCDCVYISGSLEGPPYTSWFYVIGSCTKLILQLYNQISVEGRHSLSFHRNLFREKWNRFLWKRQKTKLTYTLIHTKHTYTYVHMFCLYAYHALRDCPKDTTILT